MTSTWSAMINAGKRHWRAGLALVMCAVALGLGSASAEALTPEERCQAAKAKANWKWQRCRSNLTIRDLKRDLSDETVEQRRARCDDRHTAAFDKANRRALVSCAGDSAGVRDAVLGNTPALLGSGPSRDNFGVNIFGNSGNGAQQSAMIGTLFQHGARKFRVNNIGGWPQDAYDAINQQAGALSPTENDVSVYIPSQYFGMGTAPWQKYDADTTIAKFESWTNIKHWIIQLDACNPVEPSSAAACPASANNPTEYGLGELSAQQLTDYVNLIAANVPKFQTYMTNHPGYTVEFVIPCNDCFPTPPANLAVVKSHTVDVPAFSTLRFTLERTEYPFWDGDNSTSTNFPFAAANTFDQFAKGQGFAGAYFAESGWPRQCPSTKTHAPATPAKQCAYLKSMLHGTYADPLFISYYWVMGPLDVGDGCGAESWGLFTSSTSPVLACPASF